MEARCCACTLVYDTEEHNLLGGVFTDLPAGICDNCVTRRSVFLPDVADVSLLLIPTSLSIVVNKSGS